MRWLRRIALLLALVLLVGALGAGLGLRILRRSGLPQRAGTARIARLSAPVDVRFDDRGVPHVRAVSALDAAAAVGWLHANDRMTQLELGRRAAQGRLAEVAGPGAIELDLLALRLDLPGMAETWLAASDAETRALLEAYARGVNAWLEARDGDLPPGLRLLFIEPEPWRPQDSLGFGALLARDLSLFLPELERLDVLRRMGADALRDLCAGGAPVAIHPQALALAAALGDEDVARKGRLELELIEPEPEQDGSNAWAVGAARTRSGEPLLANDPHLGLGLPSMWYQVAVRAPDYEAAGFTLIGLPVVVVGQGPQLAWGVTNGGRDHHDFAWEERDADGRVRRGDSWREVERRSTDVRVRFGGAVPATSERTELGPVLEYGDQPFSLRWSAHAGFDPVLPFRELARSQSLADARMAIGEFLAPSQNLLLACAGEGAAHTVLGRAPDRPAGQGWLPLPARAELGWDGHRPAGDSLWIDAGSGVLASANDDPAAREGAGQITEGDFDTPYRAQRAAQLVAERDDWTPEAFAALQTDRTSLYALDVIGLLDRRGPAPTDADAARALELLRAWDGSMEVDSAPAALWIHAQRALYEAIFEDELAAHDLAELGFGYDRRTRLTAALSGALAADWFDDVRTEHTEGRAETLEYALARAWRETVAQLGDDPAHWRYGDLRTWTLAHPLSAVPFAGRWFTRGPWSVGGSATTLDAMAGRFGDDGRVHVSHGPSMRWVADPADPDRSRAVLPGGQSGHPFDVHYADQVEDFLAGRTRPVRWSEAAIEAATVSRLRLEP